MKRSFFLVAMLLAVCVFLLAESTNAAPIGMTTSSASASISYNGGPTSHYDSHTGDGSLQSAQVSDESTQITATSDAIVRGQTNLGAKAYASDGVYDGFTGNASGQSHNDILFQVTTTGTIIYGMDYQGVLTLGSGGFGYASVSFISEVRKWTGNSWYLIPDSSFNGSAKIKYQDIINPQIVTTTSGALFGATETNGIMDLNASTIMIVNLGAPGLFKLGYTLDVGAGTGDFSGGGPDVVNFSNSFDSFGFSGDFWDIVGGTAAFSDPDNPSNSHNPTNQPIPEPSTLLLFAVGTLGIIKIGWQRWKHNRKQAS